MMTAFKNSAGNFRQGIATYQHAQGARANKQQGSLLGWAVHTQIGTFSQGVPNLLEVRSPHGFVD